MPLIKKIDFKRQDNKRKNCFVCYNKINIQNNFIDEFNFWLTHRNFNLIMFDNGIFYNTLAKDIYNKFTLIK